MKTGIIQGRLSRPDEGFQDCPKNWKREFDLLGPLGLNHIEWIVTKESFGDNPVFTEDVSGYPVHSICADNMVDKRFVERNYFVNNMTPICHAATRNNVKNVTIPLLEDSDVSDDDIRQQFCVLVKELSNKFDSINFSIEAELDPDKLEEILSLGENFTVTYDTGNITSCRLDHEKYIHRFGDRIHNVHLKDRTFDAQTVAPMTGDTDFRTIFKNLKKINYTGVFTLQTARGKEGSEPETIENHKKLFQELYNERA